VSRGNVFVENDRSYANNNRIGIWGRWGDAILLAANSFSNNAEGNCITNVSNWIELPASPDSQIAPTARLR
jgi:hypothetical protein